jgi:hypothetical protein
MPGVGLDHLATLLRAGTSPGALVLVVEAVA